MRTDRLQYCLPPQLIAQQPSRIRSDARLLVLDRQSGQLADSRFRHIGRFLKEGDCLVLNDTKVLPARFFAQRSSGARLQGLFLTENTTARWEVLLKGAGKLKTGEIVYLKDRTQKDFLSAQVIEKTAEGKCLLKIKKDSAIGRTSAETILDKIGFAPLPPYIKRGDNLKQDAIDKKRYQTVYAGSSGAVAAPTAGLHFTKRLIRQLTKSGICFAYITLHVGLGTFRPISTETLADHEMHQESYSIDKENARLINSAKEKGRRIIAVGTTCVRALETASAGSRLKPTSGSTKLFIRPGYKFKMVDGLVTNFHLPESTLLALVAAFAGLKNILAAYRYAVRRRYRFYSYGDAMLII
jgi:S-adenosylmethionine:tRNA ribosyltransferase-isomerase